VRRVMTLLVMLAVGLVAVLGLVWTSQRRLIYFPARTVPATPQGFAEVVYSTDDGLSLAAWFTPPAGRGTVVVFPGNAGNRADRLPLARALAERGFGVLLVDYRGYGGNPGSPTESGLAADARAAVAHLRSRPDVDPERIAYFGESLGAAVAIGLAVEEPPAALVVRSPFLSLAAVASTHYPYLPVSLVLWDRYPNSDRIHGVDAPVLVVAGSADSVVPVAQSRALYEAAVEPKRLVIIDGADHNDRALTSGPGLVEEVVLFLDEAMPAAGR